LSGDPKQGGPGPIRGDCNQIVLEYFTMTTVGVIEGVGEVKSKPWIIRKTTGKREHGHGETIKKLCQRSSREERLQKGEHPKNHHMRNVERDTNKKNGFGVKQEGIHTEPGEEEKKGINQKRCFLLRRNQNPLTISPGVTGGVHYGQKPGKGSTPVVNVIALSLDLKLNLHLRPQGVRASRCGPTRSGHGG